MPLARGLAGRLFQRFANKLVFGHFGLLRQSFQARVEFFGYAASQRCHGVNFSALQNGCKCCACLTSAANLYRGG